MPKPRETPRGFKQLVQLSCAFGNSLTLPLIFLLTLLPAHSADTAVAFTALFLAVSPLRHDATDPRTSAPSWP